MTTQKSGEVPRWEVTIKTSARPRAVNRLIELSFLAGSRRQPDELKPSKDGLPDGCAWDTRWVQMIPDGFKMGLNRVIPLDHGFRRNFDFSHTADHRIWTCRRGFGPSAGYLAETSGSRDLARMVEFETTYVLNIFVLPSNTESWAAALTFR